MIVVGRPDHHDNPRRRQSPARRRLARRWFRAVSAMAAALLLTGCDGPQSVLAPSSEDARLMALLSWWFFGAGALILAVTLGLLVIALSLAWRGGQSRPISFRASMVLVVSGGVVAPALAVVAVTYTGVMIGDETEGADGRSATAPTVEVDGRMWWWEFRYLDKNGAVIAVTANELHLPVGERARLRLTSDNVIHSFWVPNLQGKTDLIPGKDNVLYAQPAVSGVWRGQCAEFCGMQHALMGFVVVAQPRPAYETWVADQAADAAVTSGPGLDAFLKNGCGVCHAIRGTAADGQAGPDLTHLASRATLAAATLPNTRGNLGGWITSTHEVKPGALMPAIAPEPEELQHLLDFLGALK
ncbi:cytochrome c oxidase subunit 2 [Constrictibacter sp. MBR-5]|jgi:cytochrome c oxidase subunit 2